MTPKVTGHCGRCHMVGVDQETGTKTKEPLLSLSTYRTGKVSSQQQQLQALLMHEKINYPPCYYVFLGDFRCVPDASVIHRNHSSPVCRLPCSARAKRLKIMLFILQNILQIWFKPVPLHGLRTIVKSLVFTQGCSFLYVCSQWLLCFKSPFIQKWLYSLVS